MAEKTGVILKIFGRVQGVGFRFYTHKRAVELDIAGFVKNLADGSVYIEAEGKPDQLELFIHWCHSGPSWAKVTEVQQQDSPPSGFNQFVIR